MISFYILISFSITKINQSLLFVSDVARKTIILFYCNVDCTVSIIAMFALFFAAYELNGSRFLQASVEFGLSTEKVSLKHSLLSSFLFLCSFFLHIDLCLGCFNWLTGAI